MELIPRLPGWRLAAATPGDPTAPPALSSLTPGPGVCLAYGNGPLASEENLHQNCKLGGDEEPIEVSVHS